jgi:hypothetical protein
VTGNNLLDGGIGNCAKNTILKYNCYAPVTQTITAVASTTPSTISAVNVKMHQIAASTIPFPQDWAITVG